MNISYDQNYTIEQTSVVLETIKDCVREWHYSISKNANRQENINFIKEYNLNSDKQRRILMGIKQEDFCYMLKNKKPGYEHESLYVFCPQVRLFNCEGVEELVDIYIKFNLIDYNGGNRVVVISFH